MKLTNCKTTKVPKTSLPPRRGQIKLKIIRKIAKAAASWAGGIGGKRGNGGGGCLSSASTTPHDVSSGFNSDYHSDKL